MKTLNAVMDQIMMNVMCCCMQMHRVCFRVCKAPDTDSQ